MSIEESGFIKKYKAFGKKERSAVYQLVDFYSMFFLKFINKTSTVDKNLWINSINTSEYYSWSGYAFEQICLYHLDQVKSALGVSQIQTATSAWIGDYEGQKAQIDLVIDRRDQVINLCEMKFSIHPFVITKAYAEDLQTKIRVFKSATETKKAIFLTIFTSLGLEPNEYSQQLVNNHFDMDILFST
jgi:uncharacterized protein